MKTFLKLFSFFTICFSLSCNCLYSSPIKIDDPLDFRILDQFFRIMVSQSEYGYVLENSKPISAINISSLDSLPAPHSPWFALNTYSLEAVEVWKRIHPSQSDIRLKATQAFDPKSNTTQLELLFINVPKLREAIDSNINLFRYVLGPSLESSSILNHIIESSESLSTILRDDRVLEGIVLGFGTYNSLMHSRMEVLSNICHDADILPFSRHYDLMYSSMDTLRLRAFFLSSVNSALTQSPNIKPSVTPGLGFTSASDELNFINSQILELPEVLINLKPNFIFGSYKHAESCQLPDELKIAQTRIQSLLDRPDFLEYVLEKITGEKPIINCIPQSNEHFVLQGNVEKAIAKVIWSTYSRLDLGTVSEFIEAFCSRNPLDRQRPQLNLMPGALSGLKLAQSNLNFAEDQIHTYSQKELIQEIRPDYLYFERIRVGNGNSIDSADELLLSYNIEDGHGNILAAQHNCWIKLSETFPGFILGIQGMREGEMRKIYIHPAYGYGISTSLPPCVFLIVNVTLHQVNSHSHASPATLTPHDLSWLKDPEIYHVFEQSTCKLARSLGSMWGIWLSSSADLNFTTLCEEIRCLEKSEDHLSALPTLQEQTLSNHVFWNLIIND